MDPEARLRIDGAEVQVLGTIAGYVPDAQRVEGAFTRLDPIGVALGIPPEDVEGLAALAADPDLELPEPDPQSERLFALLSRFGATRVPSPDLEAAHRLARERGLPVEALDLDDDEHSALYVKTVGFRHAIRSGRLLRKVLKADFSGHDDPYGLACAWDAYQNRLKPLQAVEAARERHMAVRLREVAQQQERVLAVVPVARFEGVVAAVRSGPGK